MRYRVYTKSRAKAVAFQKVPKIQFLDSGHGIVFYARQVPQKTYPEIFGSNSCRAHVQEHAPRDANGKRITWK